MNQYLKTIKDLFEQKNGLSEQDKETLDRAIAKADKEMNVAGITPPPVENLNDSAAIMLQETMAELENKRKTIEEKNRELEIEAALEKVRSVALAMKKRADMLDVCRVISQQMESLQVQNIRNVQTAIFNETEHIYLNYEYYRNHEKTFITEVNYTLHPIQFAFANQMLKGQGSFFSTSIEGEELSKFIEHQKSGPEFVDPFLFDSSSLTWYWSSLGPIAFGVSTYSPLDEESQEIVRRFRNVFGLSYQRYLDIENAETLAKEAHLEAALERVRSRSMAMYHSHELLEVADVLFRQLLGFGGNILNAGFVLCKPDADEDEYWISSDDGIRPVILVPHTDDPVQKKLYQGWKDKLEFYSLSKGGDELKAHYDYLVSVPALKPFFEEGVSSNRQFPTWQKWHAAYFRYGYVFMLTVEEYDEEKILVRFAKIFEQAYTRFLDLQTAEVQARESQIQLALERVRARTMAMQKSDELPEAANLLFHQIQSLGMPAWSAGYCIWGENRQTVTLWMSSEAVLQPPFKSPTTEDRLFIEMRKGDEDGKTLHIVEMGGPDLVAHYKYMRTLPVVDKILDSIIEAGYPLPVFQIMHYAYFSTGFLLFITYEPVPGSHDIFKRFALVFDQTYTRFLDLQRAEAQAREAQIETALEKVRSRSLAMHKTDELNDVVMVLFEKLKELKIPVTSAGISIYITGSRDMNVYVCGQNENDPVINNYRLPYFDHKIWKDLNNAREQESDFFVGNYSKEEKNSFYKHVFECSALKHLPNDIQNLILESPAYSISVAPVKNSMITINDFEGGVLSEVEKDIIKRFSRVFEQAYVRFLDLQTAEVQAKEAQIQLALERVRARTMAMQKSDELSEAVYILFQQFRELGENPDQATIGVINENEHVIEYWVTLYGSQINKVFRFSIDEPHVTNKIYKAWKEGQKSLVIDLSGEALLEFMAYRAAKGGATVNPDEKRRVINVAFFSKGLLNVQSNQSRSSESIRLLERFAAVFDQTYTRFLDLERAEAQAREAQIEAALERVRSRSLAMHKSEEIKEVVATVMEKMNELSIDMNGGVSLVTFIEGSQDLLHWYVNPGHVDGPVAMYLPYFDDLLFNDFVAARNAGKEILPEVYSFEEKKKYFEYAFDHSDFRIVPEELKKWVLEQPYFGYSVAIQKHSAIFFNDYTGKLFSDKENDVLIRFAKVFEQAYIRFLDLQKAEEQAKESQVQLALERIRARTAAMQHSDELAGTVSVLFKQLLGLGIKEEQIRTCAIVTFFSEEPVGECWITKPDGEIVPNSFMIPYDEIPTYKTIYSAWKRGEKFLVLHLSGDELVQHQEYLKKFTEIPIREFKGLPGQTNETFTHALFYSRGYLLIISGEPLIEYHEIFKRVGVVFQQTYTRFLDLQKAEEQAREAQIEAALERVRARTMAMFKSDELAETAVVVFQQLINLGIEPNRLYIGIINDESGDLEFWMTDEEGKQVSNRYVVNIHKNISIRKMYEGWKEQRPALSIDMLGNELHEWITYWSKEFGLPFMQGAGHQRRVQNLAYFSKGFIAITTFENAPKETVSLLNRFAAVFNLTYTRILDLQKAEAQAKEAQIEAALERVRSRSMGMQKSEELKEVIQVVYDQFVHLKINVEHTGFVIDYKTRNDYNIWIADPLGVPSQVTVPYFDSVYYNRFNEAKENGTAFFATNLSFEEKNRFYEKLFEYVPGLPEEAKKFYFSCPGLAASTVLLESVCLYIENFSGIPYTDEENDILMRFGKVFQQTYTRFLDLQKAEAQAREAQIEAALEKIRSRTAAMQKSDELKEVIHLISEQMVRLGIEMSSAGFMIEYRKTDDINSLVFSPGLQKGIQLHLPYIDHPIFKKFIEAKQKNFDFYPVRLNREEKDRLLMHIFAHNPDFPEEGKEISYSFPGYADSHVLMKNVGLYIQNYTGIPYSDADNAVLIRIGKAFEQTYTRFLDLQKAEAQAREAQIESALERVRAKAMAMHSSKDLTDTIATFYNELELFSLTPRRFGLGLLNKENRFAELSTMNSAREGKPVELIGVLDMTSHPVLAGVYENWLLQKEYHPVLRGNEITEYYKVITPQMAFPDCPDDVIQYGYFFFFNEGGVYAWTEKEMSDGELQIYRRFTSVLSLTYKRFLDLKQTEANTKEAVKQAALDRIRADIASMRTISDLDRITPLIWNELTILGVPFIRCGVFIMDDSQKLIHTFLSTPDGKAIAAFHIPYNTPGNISQVINHWHSKRDYIDHWDESAFTQFAAILVQQGALASPEQYLKTIPHGGFHLHFLPFLQGMLYVGNTDRLGGDEIKLIQSIADAFSTAYARYEDFNKLEVAKQQVDKTLIDLKQAQTQLVQSEKMASLGELTAGIAHEIQNPLNFVNNFSDVSSELLDDMKTELKKGNTDEAMFLVEDVKQNLEKILHHGKRADAIVKGMLQHSRMSSGQKESTDINVLTDEYLRLAYHGLRAKDKSFNARFETDLDKHVGKINIIPQDIGRVLVNLITNAFYAVSQRQRAESKQYEPTVSVTTKKLADKVEIIVKDNGTGIQQKVLDKIFQPFFTTKPTGQGTGLGLSLAYDIVKAHGGDIMVRTKEGEGSEFVVSLPV